MKNPIDLLPIKHPIKYDPSIDSPSYFYDNVVHHLIPDIIRVMSNGIPIDLDKVKELETTVTDVLDNVSYKLASNPIILDFQASVYPKRFKAFKEEQEAKKRTVEDYKINYTNSVLHRTYVVNAYLKLQDKQPIKKATIKDLKELNLVMESKTLELIIKGDVPEALIEKGMLDLANDKLAIYNKSIDTKIKEVDKTKLLSPFNPASSKQKYSLLTDTLGFKSGVESKTYKEYWKHYNRFGEPPRDKRGNYKKEPNKWSWGRDELEALQKTLSDKDKSLKELIELLVDHSFSAIIRNNFIEAFKVYTVNDVLYGNLNLGGTKSWRLSSTNPNLLNLPSTGSIYAKPLKKCFTAPEGTIILTADYSALNNDVTNEIIYDENKQMIVNKSKNVKSSGVLVGNN